MEKNYSYSKSKSKRIKSLVNDDIVEKKPILYPNKAYKRKRDYSYSKSKSILKKKKKGWLGKKFK